MDTDPIVVSRHEADGRKLELAILLACNTEEEQVAKNIRVNSAREELEWFGFSEAHDGTAVIVGGGPSIADEIDQIRAFRQNANVTLFGLNGASRWLRRYGVHVDCQIMIDARDTNLEILDTKAPKHILGSQVSPKVVEAANDVTLMHLSSKGCEENLPKDRKEKGGYALVGGGYGVGNTAICAAYVMGYREIHCFGLDSSHRNGKGHAYDQPINDGIECVVTEFDGRKYVSSLPMKAQADRFLIIANDLEEMGCLVHVHGDGLLPAMFNSRTPSEGK